MISPSKKNVNNNKKTIASYKSSQVKNLIKTNSSNETVQIIESERNNNQQLIGPSDPKNDEPIGTTHLKSVESTQSMMTNQWKPYTLQDAFMQRDPIQYIARPLFALPSLNIVYGAPGSLKSFLLADLVCCVAQGKDWLKPELDDAADVASPVSFPTIKVPCMWCDFDNGPHRTHDRFKVLALSHKLEKDNPNIFYYSMPDPWLDVGNAVDMAALTNRMKEFGIKLLVIDNLGVVIGNVDENSRDMAQIMSALRQLAESTGAAVILIHHRVKGNNNNNGGRSGDTLRGHSSIEASLDLALRVDRVGQSETITIKPTKVRGENLSEFPAIFRAGPDLENQLVFADFAGPVVIDPIYTIVRDAVRSILTDKQHNQKELIKAVVLHLQEIEADAIGENSIRHYIQKMVDENKLVVLKGSKTEKLYSLPTPPSSTKPASEPASGSVPAETAPGGVSAEPASGSVPAEPVAPESLPEKPPSNEPSSRKSRSKKPSSGSTSTEPAPESLPEKPPSNESPQ